jgi:hypothetical protein
MQGDRHDQVMRYRKRAASNQEVGEHGGQCDVAAVLKVVQNARQRSGVGVVPALIDKAGAGTIAAAPAGAAGGTAVIAGVAGERQAANGAEGWLDVTELPSTGLAETDMVREGLARRAAGGEEQVQRGPQHAPHVGMLGKGLTPCNFPRASVMGIVA